VEEQLNRSGERRGVLQLKRLEMLMDVVFALMIWRIIMLLPTPQDGELDLTTLTELLFGNLSDFLIILIGIVMVTVYWLQSNMLFGTLRKTDTRHAAGGIIQLFLLLIYLYFMRMGIRFDEETMALLMQSISLALVGIAGSINWSYAVKDRRLLADDVPDETVRTIRISILAEPLVAVISIPCAFIGPVAWEVAFLSYPIIAFILKRRIP